MINPSYSRGRGKIPGTAGLPPSFVLAQHVGAMLVVGGTAAARSRSRPHPSKVPGPELICFASLAHCRQIDMLPETVGFMPIIAHAMPLNEKENEKV